MNTTSESGLMKARWTQEDFSEMSVLPLPFTRYDIDLIHKDLARRVVERSGQSGFQQFNRGESADRGPRVVRALEGRS